MIKNNNYKISVFLTFSTSVSVSDVVPGPGRPRNFLE